MLNLINFVKNLTKFKDRQNKKYIQKNLKFYEKYLSEIVCLSYNGMPRFQKFN